MDPTDQAGCRHAVFTRWRTAARRRRSLRERATQWDEQRAARTQRAAWERWADAHAEAPLRRSELAVWRLRRRSLLASCLGHWVQTTDSLPALALRRTALGKRFVRHWRARLAERRAVRFARRAILGAALTRWRSQTTQMHELRAIARMKGASHVTHHFALDRVRKLKTETSRFSRGVRLRHSAPVAGMYGKT